jgi:hypothetical protein
MPQCTPPHTIIKKNPQLKEKKKDREKGETLL